jgi:hypothetical protein
MRTVFHVHRATSSRPPSACDLAMYALDAPTPIKGWSPACDCGRMERTTRLRSGGRAYHHRIEAAPRHNLAPQCPRLCHATAVAGPMAATPAFPATPWLCDLAYLAARR